MSHPQYQTFGGQHANHGPTHRDSFGTYQNDAQGNRVSVYKI